MFSKLINIGIRAKIRKAVPVLTIILGIIFVLREMNVRIPILSPKIFTQTEVSSVMESY
ncbi:MAG: hypothetical protein IT277_09810 [Ignavibacteriaceae bacterium]|nr:hypothetical protein [Ignavibacteriaceae bacterium]